MRAVTLISRSLYATIAALGFGFLSPGLRALVNNAGLLSLERPLRFPFAWAALALVLLALTADLLIRAQATLAKRATLLVVVGLCALLRRLPAPSAIDPKDALLRAQTAALTALDTQWRTIGRYQPAMQLPRRPSGYVSRLREVSIELIVQGDRAGPLLEPLSEGPAVLLSVAPDGQTAWVTVQEPHALLVGKRGPLIGRATRGIIAPPGSDPLLPPYKR